MVKNDPLNLILMVGSSLSLGAAGYEPMRSRDPLNLGLITAYHATQTQIPELDGMELFAVIRRGPQSVLLGRTGDAGLAESDEVFDPSTWKPIIKWPR